MLFKQFPIVQIHTVAFLIKIKVQFQCECNELRTANSSEDQIKI